MAANRKTRRAEVANLSHAERQELERLRKAEEAQKPVATGPHGQCCRGCALWWVKDEENRDKLDTSNCRRFPPIPVPQPSDVTSFFPATSWFAWCGEHRALEPKK